jgi:hypothetical protein
MTRLFFCHRILRLFCLSFWRFSDEEAIDYVREKAAEGNIAKKGMLVAIHKRSSLCLAIHKRAYVCFA